MNVNPVIARITSQRVVSYTRQQTVIVNTGITRDWKTYRFYSEYGYDSDGNRTLRFYDFVEVPEGTKVGDKEQAS